MSRPSEETRSLPGPSCAQSKTEAVVAAEVADLQSEVDAADLRAVVARTRAGDSVDYDREWKAFAAAYLLINFRKALAAIRPMPLGAAEVVVDAGCGMGPAAAALLTVLKERSRRGPDLIHLVDRSTPQLVAAQRLVSTAAAELGMATEVRIAQCDLSTDSMPPASLVLMSHVLGELLPSELPLVIERTGLGLEDHGAVIAIERSDEYPWRALSRSALTRCDLSDGQFTAWAPHPASLAEPERGWNSRWLLASKAEDWAVDLVRRYFLAWNQQNTDALSQVFRADAVYVEKPDKEPMRGLPAIEEYWNQRVLTQRRPRARCTRVHYGPLSASVEWEAQFLEPDGTHVHILGQMQLEFDPHTRKVCELREVFRTVRTGGPDD